MSAGTYDENGEWQGEQKEYKEVEKIVHKEVIKEVTVGVSEEELSKARGRAEIDRCASWKLDAIERTQSRGQRRADGVGRPTFLLATQVHAEAERKKEEIRERVSTRRRRT